MPASMQTYDLVMLAVLAGATIFGFWKGLAWQVASLASLVVSYFVALRFADQVAPMVSEHAPFNKFAAMLIIYAVKKTAPKLAESVKWGNGCWLKGKVLAWAAKRPRIARMHRVLRYRF